MDWLHSYIFRIKYEKQSVRKRFHVFSLEPLIKLISLSHTIKPLYSRGELQIQR